MTIVIENSLPTQPSAIPKLEGCALAGSSACVRGQKRPELLQVSVITDDPAAAAQFYAALFYASHEPSVDPQSYRGVSIKGGLIGFSTPDVREGFNLSDCGPMPNGETSDTGFFTVKLACADAVLAFSRRAEELGAKLLSAPALMPYGWFCAMLRDPAGHVFRLAALPK
ncbi:MAG: VOC family protein [Pseudomonadota bacterium]